MSGIASTDKDSVINGLRTLKKGNLLGGLNQGLPLLEPEKLQIEC